MERDTKYSMARWIFKQIHSTNYDNLVEKDPLIISCGGIFIPQVDPQKHHLFVLMSAKEEEPIKVVTDDATNPLFSVIAKETMN